VNREPTTLFIDADDTLWENNVYFEAVMAEFIATLGQRGHSASHVEQLLWQHEQHNIQAIGYGTKGFCQSLREVVRELGAADLVVWAEEKENWIFHHPIDLMPGVREALPLLHAANQLIVLTKGRADEQLGKLGRSGLMPFFHSVEVVAEKNLDTYQKMIAKYALAPERAWMIGNSPRSDINPAKAAGLGTVFIPYHTTWQHELEEIAPDGKTIMLENFGQLPEYFVQKSA
jgi:putative hydrolase of the HAD superfamily